MKALTSLATTAAKAYTAYATGGASTAMDAATFASGGLNPAYAIL